MSLKTYHKKRKFNQTPEPKGKLSKSKGPFHFVVQKHAATRLHYDFRLEYKGVLLSWAVPKGPSLNFDEKRLAMMVEDHPIDYMKFEGVIPDGNYGAGTVMVWDFGNYAEQLPFKEGLKKGDLKFILNGKKIKGGFALVKLKNSKDKNAWLLIKEKDQYMKQVDITKKDKSVLSGKSMTQIAKSDNIWKSNRKHS